MPRVSVVIPSYNHEKYITECVQSVLDQTFQDFEIVITDDGSSDNSVEKIRKFKDPRIKLFIFEKNRGASAATNNCIKKSEGKFISILSSDDKFYSEKLEKQVNFIEKHNEIGAVFGYAKIIDEKGNDVYDKNNYYCQIFIQNNKNRFEWLKHFFFDGNCLCHPSVLVRRKCYDKVGFYDERLAQLPDFDFWVRLCLKYEIFIFQENLIEFRYRENGRNASGARKDSRIRSRNEYLYVLRNYFKINSGKEFKKIFPDEFNCNENELDEESIKFFLALIAVHFPSQIHQKFGLDTLFDLLENEKISRKIKDKFNFGYLDFIKLMGKYNFFS